MDKYKKIIFFSFTKVQGCLLEYGRSQRQIKKYPKYKSIEDWLNKLSVIYINKYYVALKMLEIKFTDQ